MRIETTRRALELPEPTIEELSEATGMRIPATQMERLVAVWAAGVKAALEAEENMRGARLERAMLEGKR